jgi:TonB family protein
LSVLVYLAWFTFMVVRTRRVVEKTWDGRMNGVRILMSESAGPAVAGIWRYEILIPRWVSTLGPEDQALVLRHEEEHARVYDPLVRVAAMMLLATMPWNPLLWLALRRLERAIEVDCDRRVVRAAVEPRRYADLLLKVSGRNSNSLLLAASLNEAAAQLRYRLHAMRAPANGSAIRIISFCVLTLAVLTGAVSIPRPAVLRSADASPASVDSSHVYFEWQVDRPVAMTEDIVAEYPAALRAANVRGDVVVEFVVNALGRVEKNSVRVERAANDLFAASVKDALMRARFEPALLHGKAVRQRVEQSFQFRLSPTVSSRISSAPTRYNAGDRRSVSDSIEVLARKLEPEAFNPGSTQSWVIALEFDENGALIRHTRLAVPDEQGNLRVLYPKLFSRPAEANDAPYQVMSLIDGVRGGRSVQVVAVFKGVPPYAERH